jgi:hypothetical protein
MIEFGELPFLNEVYWVERTIEVVVTPTGAEEPLVVRIEALRNPLTERCSTRACRRENFTLQPTFPLESGEFVREPERHDFWVPYDLPWTDAATPDEAIERALRFLGQRCQ